MATIESALLPVYSRLTRLTTPSMIKEEDPKAVIELIFATRLEQMRIGEKNTINTLVDTLKDKESLLTFSHSSTVITALLQLAGEGYTDKEIEDGTYLNDMKSWFDDVFNYEPLLFFKQAFVVWEFPARSNEYIADGRSRDTYFNIGISNWSMSSYSEAGSVLWGLMDRFPRLSS